MQPVYEDPADRMIKEGELPANIDLADPKVDDPQERARIMRLHGEPHQPAGRFRFAGAALDRAGGAWLDQRNLAHQARATVPGAG